jgi:membrane protease subunit (stomatin/prohibitin family)
MGLMDYLKTQLLEIIQWEDDSRDTISWRFPDEDKEIKRGAQLIVRESQNCQFIYLGQFGDTFGPGKHTLTTDNIPILSTLKGWKYGFESPFKADVYFVTTRLFTGNKWGTSNPVMMRDQDFGIVRVRAFGTFDFKVVDVKTFLKEVAGTDHQFRLDEFADTMRSRIISVFTDALASAKVPVLDVASRYSELGDALLPLINPALIGKYGIELASFIVENVSVPPEVEQAVDKRSSMAAIGNLNDRHRRATGRRSGNGPANGGGDEPASRHAGDWRSSATARRGVRCGERHSANAQSRRCRQHLGRERRRRAGLARGWIAQGQENRFDVAHQQSGTGRVFERLTLWI